MKRLKSGWGFLPCVWLLCTVQAYAIPLRIKTLDKSGAGLPDALVIVRSLDHGQEMFRALSDGTGTVPTHDLPPGLYRAIATFPYGPWKTTIHEFMMKSTAVDLNLLLDVLPTQDWVTVGSPHFRIEARDPEGRPVPSVDILVRDANALSETWYETGIDGAVTAAIPPLLPPGDLTSIPTINNEVTVIAVFHGDLFVETLVPKQPNAKNGTVTLRLK